MDTKALLEMDTKALLEMDTKALLEMDTKAQFFMIYAFYIVTKPLLRTGLS
jgi:hypothetical protein